MSSRTVSSFSSFSTFLNQYVFSLCVTTRSHISFQKRLLPSESVITLCVLSYLLNNLFQFDSNKQFCLHCSVLLSNLSSFALWITSVSFTTHINSSFSSSLQLSSQLLLLIFHHLLETNSCGMFPAAAHTHVLVQPRLLCPLPF